METTVNAKDIMVAALALTALGNILYNNKTREDALELLGPKGITEDDMLDACDAFLALTYDLQALVHAPTEKESANV